MEPFLHLQHIRHRYNGRVILDIPDLKIERGSITGLAGPNGSGKSTLLRILSLTEKCTAGTILVDGGSPLPRGGDAGPDVTLLPQEPYLLRRSVFDNVAYGLRIRGRTEGLAGAVTAGLGLVGLDAGFMSRKWNELSGGEAQRVALAARLVLRPACLLLDEPTASVDLKSGLLIRQAILEAREQWGTTLVIASHQRTWLHDLCDHLLFLYNGRLLDCGPDNLLPCPWTQTENGEWHARLADGQQIVVSQPPSADSSAVLPPTALNLANGSLKEGEHTLRGTVTGLYADKHLPGPCLHVNCGGLLLLAMAPGDQFGLDACRPGKEVLLRYRPDAIIWLD